MLNLMNDVSKHSLDDPHCQPLSTYYMTDEPPESKHYRSLNMYLRALINNIALGFPGQRLSNATSLALAEMRRSLDGGISSAKHAREIRKTFILFRSQ